MADLFTFEELAAYLQRDLDAATATQARRIAYGWLKSATSLTDWPDPVPDDLWAWGLELAALAYVSPEGLVTEDPGGVPPGWSGPRWEQILREARRKYADEGGPAAPVGSFPPPPCWPDPIRIFR